MTAFLKILISAILIWVISEAGKRHAFAGAVLASIPLVSVLSMIWIYHDTHDVTRMAQFSMGVFWLVIPSLLLFLLLPVLLLRFQMGFYPAMGLSVLATVIAYFVMTFVLQKCGVSL